MQLPLVNLCNSPCCPGKLHQRKAEKWGKGKYGPHGTSRKESAHPRPGMTFCRFPLVLQTLSAYNPQNHSPQALGVFISFIASCNRKTTDKQKHREEAKKNPDPNPKPQSCSAIAAKSTFKSSWTAPTRQGSAWSFGYFQLQELPEHGFSNFLGNFSS